MMSKKWFVLLAGCLVLALGMGVAQAYPQFEGPTGLIHTPTAYLVGHHNVDLAVGYAGASYWGTGYEGWPTRVIAGISDNMELGGMYLRLLLLFPDL